MAPTKLGSRAAGYIVLHAPVTEGGDPNDGPTAYDDFVADGLLAPGRIEEFLAPKPARAHLEMDLSVADCHAWGWRRELNIDDRVRIVSDHPNPADRHVAFDGFVVEGDWGFGQDGAERAQFVAVSRAGRLARDQGYICYGRYMWSWDESAVNHYSALPLAFNTKKLPNHSATRDTAFPAAYYGGLGVFTYDGDPRAEYWTLGDAIDYLVWHYNAAELWVDNPDAPADGACEERVQIGCEGLDLWSALAAAAAWCGYDVAERITNDGAGGATSKIYVVKRGAGTARTLKHQPPNREGGFDRIDLAKTNVFSMSLAESTASGVSRPIVAGGQDLIEMTVELGRAWDPTRLAVPAGSWIVPPGLEETFSQELYCRRFCVGGDLHDEYADVGRLWLANTAARFNAAPYNLSTDHLGDQDVHSGGTWPLMELPPRDALTGLGVGVTGSCSPVRGCLLEVQFTGEGVWRPVAEGWEPLADRLGVRITARNLQSILYDPAANTGMFSRLVADPATIRLRLTCSVAGPQRHIATPARRLTAGSRFESSAWFDRGVLGQRRDRGPSTRFLQEPYWWDESTPAQEAQLGIAAEDLQDELEDRTIEAALTIEWPDETPRLTDVITRIEGIDVALGTNAGQAIRYPRIVQRNLFLMPETYSMQLVLGSQRKAPIR